MMKLVISLDEIGIEHEIITYKDASLAADKVSTFLENQFPQFDVGMAFDFRHLEWDFNNNEVSILMRVI